MLVFLVPKILIEAYYLAQKISYLADYRSTIAVSYQLMGVSVRSIRKLQTDFKSAKIVFHYSKSKKEPEKSCFF